MRLQVILMSAACYLAACSDSTQDSASIEASSSTVAAGATGGTQSASVPPTTMTLSLGGYSVTPLRSDAQRVTFRLTLPDGATGEVAISPPNTTISLVEPSIGLLRPDGQPAGGGEIFTASAGDKFFTSYCADALGGNCTPRTNDPIADGNRVETFMRTDGGIVTRVVFGPWAMFVQGRDIADAFAFHGGPDGFPMVAARAPGYATKNAYLTVVTNGGPRYVMRSDPSGACSTVSSTRIHCDRGLSIEALGSAEPATVRRMN